MDLTLRKADFEKAADEIMARIERDGAIHRSSIVDAMVAVAATVPAVANVVPARGLAATVVDSEYDAYDKWLAEQQRARNDRQRSQAELEYASIHANVSCQSIEAATAEAAVTGRAYLQVGNGAGAFMLTIFRGHTAEDVSNMISARLMQRRKGEVCIDRPKQRRRSERDN